MGFRFWSRSLNYIFSSFLIPGPHSRYSTCHFTWCQRQIEMKYWNRIDHMYLCCQFQLMKLQCNQAIDHWMYFVCINSLRAVMKAPEGQQFNPTIAMSGEHVTVTGNGYVLMYMSAASFHAQCNSTHSAPVLPSGDPWQSSLCKHAAPLKNPHRVE